MTGRQVSPLVSLYGLLTLPASALSPSVAGFGGFRISNGVGVGVPVGVGLGVGVGVAVGYCERDIGGGVPYGPGQIDPITPVELNGSGGFVTFTTPIVLLYRMLLGSALANIGA